MMMVMRIINYNGGDGNFIILMMGYDCCNSDGVNHGYNDDDEDYNDYEDGDDDYDYKDTYDFI